MGIRQYLYQNVCCCIKCCVDKRSQWVVRKTEERDARIAKIGAEREAAQLEAQGLGPNENIHDADALWEVEELDDDDVAALRRTRFGGEWRMVQFCCCSY